MILVRSPLRLSIAGGATDLKGFYSRYGGFCISAAINKYVYVSVHRTFQEEIILKYSVLENVKKIEDVDHSIIKEALKILDFKTPQIEITSHADVPSGSGLGSSSSFTCALLKALYSHRNKHIMPNELAKMACKIEIDILKGNLGKQDQTISAFGGLQSMYFYANETVDVLPLKMKVEDLYKLEDSILLFFTGFTRTTNEILKDQVEKTKKLDDVMFKNLLNTKQFGFEAQTLLRMGDVYGYGKLMHKHWMNKRKRSPNMTNHKIDEWYNTGMKAAHGGKLVGAGGSGGFLMFVTDSPQKLRKAMEKTGLEEMRFQFDFEGTKRII